VHDLFDILGVPTDAAASEVRRACARRVRRLHPDFSEATAAPPHAPHEGDARPADVAIDFADMRAFVDQIQSAFFGPSDAANAAIEGPPASDRPDPAPPQGGS
jgi:hypothetical protein